MQPKWTPTSAGNKSQRKLAALKNLIEQTFVGIAYQWGDVDQFLCGRCDELRNIFLEECGRLAEEISEVVRERSETESEHP